MSKLNYPQDYKPAHKLDTITADNYKPERGSEYLFHVKEERIYVNSKGVRTSTPAIQTYPARKWSALQRHLVQMGYTLIVLYDPTEYNAKHEKEKAEASASSMVSASAFQKALADRDKKHADELAELRKEMKAMMGGKSATTAKKGGKKSASTEGGETSTSGASAADEIELILEDGRVILFSEANKTAIEPESGESLLVGIHILEDGREITVDENGIATISKVEAE